MLKKCKVVMLPTNEKANEDKLIYREDRLMFQTKKEAKHDRKWSSSKHYHLYFLSDEEIKKGDWRYDRVSDTIGKAKFDTKPTEDSQYLKVIATTDSSLEFIKINPNGGFNEVKQLPQPSQSFLEVFVREYNKGFVTVSFLNVIKEVLVEYELDEDLALKQIQAENPKFMSSAYIPKINTKDNTITIKRVKDSWNREEVIGLIKDYRNQLVSVDQLLIDKTNKWIEQNL